MKTFLLRLALLVLFLLPSAASAQSVTHDETLLDSLKSIGHTPYYASTDSLRRNADKLLNEKPLTVTAKSILPPSGDSHDYVSLGIYYWPDATKPGGLPYVNRDGQVNPEKDDLTRYDGPRLDRLTSWVEQLALAYRATGHEQYAVKALELLSVWFIESDTKMNPNLNFGQGAPGRGSGSASGIIETTSLIRIVDAIGMLEKSPHFTDYHDKGLKGWFSAYIDWLQTSPLGKREADASNNHGVWYDAQVVTYARYVGRTDIALRVLADVPQKRIFRQVEPDGTMPRELARTKAQSYTAYNLQAFICLARAAEPLGVNLWDCRSTDGRSILAALQWFAPYLAGEKPWAQSQIADFKPSGFGKYLYLANLHYKDPLLTKTLTAITK